MPRSQTISISHRVFLPLLLLALAGCHNAIDHAIARGAAYLASRQDADGSWRAGSHAVFRDGTALTPHVLLTLQMTDRERDGARRGRAWMESIDESKLEYPTYGAADAAYVLPADRWLALLRSRQMRGDDTGASQGGWAYPAGPLGPRTEANLSATAYAVCALADAGAAADDPQLAAALRFILRCRNDDGGFLFGPLPDADNKAGPRVSYGTMTADGLRGMLACGVGRDDPRVVAAVDWLLDRLDPANVSGDFTPARAPMRNANYFYFADALTDALTRAGVPRHKWADPIAAELLRRQNPDGSWHNSISAGREDERIVSTAFAIRALARCR